MLILAKTLYRYRIILLLFTFLSQAVWSEILPVDLVLESTSDEVHIIRGWMQAPARIDMSKLKLVTAAEPDWDRDFGDDEYFDDNASANDDWGDDYVGGDDDYAGGDDNNLPGSETSPPQDNAGTSEPAGNTTPAPTPSGNQGGGNTTPAPSPVTGNDQLSSPAPSPSPADGGRRMDAAGGVTPPRVKQVLDIVLFLIPDNCKTDFWGECDWTTLGVGAADPEMIDGISYCCSEDTASRKLCDSNDIGRLILDPTKFKGDIRAIDVPTKTDETFLVDPPTFDIDVTGDYVLALANCDDYGLRILTMGSIDFKDANGYLPGEKYGLLFFYTALTLIYFFLVLWYGCGMKIHQDAAIPIQKYIIATIFLGLFELFFRTIDLGLWSIQGTRSIPVVYTFIVLGVLKRGTTRCLGVMVAMGWGVVRDSLGSTLARIVTLGLVYSVLTMLLEILLEFAQDEFERLSVAAEEETVDFALILIPAVLLIDLIFFFWIMNSLNATTEYLKNMGQTSKLRRHLRLRCLIITSISIAAAWLAFSIINVFTSLLRTDQTWILEGLMHANSLFVLIGVAILWKPNPNAKEYAMQMEVPAMGEDGENELELSCVVPSAGDIDDGENGDPPGRFMIDNAVAS